MKGTKKDTQDLVDIAVQNGWTCTSSAKNHHRLVSPTGAIVILAKTPSSGRAFHNYRALLRRHGLRGKL